jgi:hypothetical protein
MKACLSTQHKVMRASLSDPKSTARCRHWLYSPANALKLTGMLPVWLSVMLWIFTSSAGVTDAGNRAEIEYTQRESENERLAIYAAEALILCRNALSVGITCAN